jgi:hypothetical protein
MQRAVVAAEQLWAAYEILHVGYDADQCYNWHVEQQLI